MKSRETGGPTQEVVEQQEWRTLAENLRNEISQMWPLVLREDIDARALAEFPLFQSGTMDILQAHPVIGKYIGHDVRNLANAISIVEVLSEGGNEDNTEFMQMARHIVPAYVFTMEDILQRLEATVGRDASIPELPAVDASQLVQLLEADITSISQEKHLELQLQVPEVPGQIDGEVIGTLYNGVRNMIRNAAHPSVGATTLSFRCEAMDAVHGIFEIADDGGGLTAAQLDPSDEEHFIFRTGVSQKGSSGLGLGDLVDRFGQKGCRVAVVSNGIVYNPDNVPVTDMPTAGTKFIIDVPLKTV